MTIFAIVLGVVSLLTGVPKLLALEQVRDNMAAISVDTNLTRAIGALEVAAAVGLQISSLRSWAAAGMVLMMVGAIGHHVKAKQPIKESIPAVVVGVAMTVFLVMSL